MKYTLKAPPSLTEQTLSFEIPDLPATITPVITGTTQPTGNLPPVVNAGQDLTITLPINSVTLNGSGNDPDGTIKSFLWTRVSGMGGTIINPTNAITTVTGLTEGVHIFKLTVTDDSDAQSSDNATVTVKPAIVIPPPGVLAYEGFGKNATGGRNSTDVRIVKTPAEFTSALGSNRTILFGADVTLTGNNARVNLANKSYLTIDGNGHNVTFDNGNNGDCISFDGNNCHHILLQGVRTRNAGNDGINVLDGAHDIMIHRCSSYENRDGNVDIVAGSYNVTVQYCFIGGGINYSGYSGSNLVGYAAKNISEHHNLISPVTPGQVGERCPNVSDNSGGVFMCDFRNNIVWNWGRSGGTGSGYATAVFNNGRANVVNNLYYTKNTQYASKATNTDDGYGNAANGQMYAAGNVSKNTGVNPNSKSNHAEFPIPSEFQIAMQSAEDAGKITLANLGLPVEAWTDYEKQRISEVVIS